MKLGTLMLIALAASLTACGGSGAGTAPHVCPDNFPVPPQLVYPSPSATNIPDGNFAIIFYTNSGTVAAWSAPVLTPAQGGSTVQSGPYELVPTPGPIEYTSEVPALQPATEYAISIATLPLGACSSTQTLGSFTTR